MQAETEFEFPSPQGSQKLFLFRGKPIILVGKNGSGKSAFVHHLRVKLSGRGVESLVYLPGSRPSFLDNEKLMLSPEGSRQLSQNVGVWDQQNDTRWKSQFGTQRNELAIFKILTAEQQYRYDALERVDAAKNFDEVKIIRARRDSPLDRLNEIFLLSNLKTTLKVENGEIVAQRQGQLYSVAKMSDGERSALFICANIIVAAKDAVVIIDEPERHLHRSISMPLLAAIIREREDINYIISTHELELPFSIPNAQVLAVQNCTWSNGNITAWEVDILPAVEDVPESLRVDILGARNKILMVEGKLTSLDQPLYGLLFPDVSVGAREGCVEVERAVVGLRSLPQLHHIQIAGIVDNDLLSPGEIERLAGNGVYALPVFSVESLYYCRDVRIAVARHQAVNLGLELENLISEAEGRFIASLMNDDTINRMIARVANRIIRQKFLSSIPEKSVLLGGNVQDVVISIGGIMESTGKRLRNSLSTKDVDGIISSYPVRESRGLDAIAKALRFQSKKDYERAALTRIKLDNVLLEQVRRILSVVKFSAD